MALLQVPDRLAATVRARGKAGQEWLDSLPGLLAQLQSEWGVSFGNSLEGGNAAYVVEATTADGGLAVLKASLPLDFAPFTQELAALEAADGDPYVGLMRSDAARRCLLLERLGRPLSQLMLPTDKQIEVIVALLARSWRPANDARLRRGGTKARWLAEFVEPSWEQLGRPCSERAAEHAVALALKCARHFDDERTVLVHGDAHRFNVLEVRGASAVVPQFRLIDPEGLASEPEHDLGVLLRDWNDELLDTDTASEAIDRHAVVARRTGTDPARIWRWSFVERLTTGLFMAQLGHHEEARAYFDVTDRLVDAALPWS